MTDSNNTYRLLHNIYWQTRYMFFFNFFLLKDIESYVRTGSRQCDERVSELMLQKRSPAMIYQAEDVSLSTANFLLAVQYNNVPVIWGRQQQSLIFYLNFDFY